MTLDESRKRNDMVIESQGIRIAYEADLEKYVRDSVIDYSNGWFNKGIVLKGTVYSACLTN